MKIIITTLVDKTWPIHKVSVQTDDDVIIAEGESRNSPGYDSATVQAAAEDVIYNMEQQLKQAREHMILNGLIVNKTNS